MSYRRWISAGTFAALGALILVEAACGGAAEPSSSDPSTVPTVPVSSSVVATTRTESSVRTQFGFGLSPASYAGSDLPDFLDRIDGNADFLMHAGDWGELDESVFTVAATLARDTGLGFVAVVSPNAAGNLTRPLDETTRSRYLASIAAFVSEQRPAYLGLANEVNMLATDDPVGFEATVSLWDEALAIVREKSPETTVFVTFQLEWLLGYREGWFGRSEADPQWDLIDRFKGADVVGFTTYPSLVFDAPGDLPPDYYTQIGLRTRLPVIFTEIGWTAFEDLPLLPGSEIEQVEFLDLLGAQTAALDVRLMVWSFVRADLVSQQPFRAMDLVRPDGTERPSWQRWLDLRR